jgi:hypothetical protein
MVADRIVYGHLIYDGRQSALIAHDASDGTPRWEEALVPPDQQLVDAPQVADGTLNLSQRTNVTSGPNTI